MKKLGLIILTVLCFSLTGCSSESLSANSVARNHLEKYRSLDEVVMKKIDETFLNDSLSLEQQKEYKEVLKRQFLDLEYEVLSEKYNNSEAIVDIKVSVYDYFQTNQKVKLYSEENTNEFMDEGTFSTYKFNEFLLTALKEETKRVSYNIKLNLEYVDNNWKLKSLSQEDLEKIHGIYNYET